MTHSPRFSVFLMLALAWILACDRTPPPARSPAVPSSAQPETPAQPGIPPPTGPDPATTDSLHPDEGRTVSVFFTLGESTVPATRMVADTTQLLSAALAALLRGPTEAERARGITSWFSDETAGTLRSATVDSAGRAIIDFTGLPGVIPGASSSAGSAQLLAALHGTIFQFDGIVSAEYRLDGSCEAFWNWLQRACTIVEREDATGAP